MSQRVGAAREPIREEDVEGLKYFRKLWPLFERLHEVGCKRDKAGNRELFMDQYCGLVLLFMFNPCLRSLRALQQASELKNVQRKLGCSRASLGSLSEATDVFDPQRLREIIGQLATQVHPTRNVAEEHVRQLLMAVDGSVVKTLSTIAAAAYLKTKNGDSRSAWRLHTHFDVDRGIPTRIDVTTARNSGKTEEKNVLRTQLAADHCYLMDRWYAQFTLFNEIHAIGSSYVCRIRDNSRYEVLEERLLSDAAREAGVLSDELVELGAGSPSATRPNHPIRLVLVKCTPHQKTGGRKGGTAGPPSDGILRIATNLLDPPAEIIAELYRQRWTIELFFRFFKHVLGCRHLLSTAQAGIEIQTYVAIIACLLLALWTGGKPTLRTYEMVCLYLQGWADEEEFLAHLKKLKPAGH
jgi:Transposase DDE domain